MKVLIVDDSKAMHNIITKAMRSVGYLNDEYSYAFDGEAALQIIRGDRPDIVLCDMHMPKMTGLEMLKALRAEKDSTKVIIVSIDENEKTEASIRAAGGDAYLNKPFTAEQLFNTISALTGKAVTKKPSVGRAVQEVTPPKPILERVFSSLAGADVQLVDARFEDIDFDRSPYYGGTFQDDNNRVVLSIFLDALVANTIAAIISRQPLGNALQAANAKRIDTAAKQSLLAFLGLFTALCAPSKSGQLLDIHAEHYAENAHTHLSKHMRQYTASMLVYSFNCGHSQGGKIILVTP